MDNKKTGKFISLCRKQKGMTQQELANMIGITNKSISKWETGEGSPDINNLLILAKLLEVSVEEILEGEFKTVEVVSSIENRKISFSEEYKYYLKKFYNWCKDPRVIAILISVAVGGILGICAYNNGWLG